MIEIDDSKIGSEVSKLLSDLIRIDTTNPPGNELKAAEYLYNFFMKEGVEGEIIESGESRGNYYLRIPGENKGKNLMFLSHLDVVPADPEEWSVPPFSGLIKDGFVWGRGALDCKGLVAVQAWAILQIIREGFKRKNGDIIFLATADEEMLSTYGVKWLFENRPEIVKNVDYLITEGGGTVIKGNKRNKYTIEVGQKGVYWYKVTTKGPTGHGSTPKFEETAITKLATVILRMKEYKTPIKFNKITRQTISELLDNHKLLKILFLTPKFTDYLIRKLSKKDPGAAAYLNAMLRDTIVPTVVKGGSKTNVIPGKAEVQFDVRLLLGSDEQTVLMYFKDALKELYKEVSIEKGKSDLGANFSEFENVPFYQAIERVIKRLDSKAHLVPTLMTGATDSRFFRKQGTIAYGFQPISPDIPLSELSRIVHGVDERISIDSLVLGAKFMYSLLKEPF